MTMVVERPATESQRIENLSFRFGVHRAERIIKYQNGRPLQKARARATR
jgi:hypothetical protein